MAVPTTRINDKNKKKKSKMEIPSWNQWGTDCATDVLLTLLGPFICFAKHFAGFIVIIIYGHILLGILFLSLLIFGGPTLIYHATVGTAEEKKLMQNYRENGLRINGRVEKQWRNLESTSSDTQAWIEKAIVSYDLADGIKYHMKLVPVDEKVRESIAGRDIPILLLAETPTSGVPAAFVDPDSSWSVPLRFAAFIGGCVIASYWVSMVYLFSMELRDDKGENSALICIVGGVVANLLLAVIVFYRNKCCGHPMLTFSERVDGEDVLSFIDNDMGSHNPLVEIDKQLRKGFAFVMSCRCLQPRQRVPSQEATD